MKYTNKEYATLAHQATLKGKLLVVHDNGSYEMIDLPESEEVCEEISNTSSMQD